jgi:small redox-active disulfide protein 2
MKDVKVYGPGCKRCEATEEMVKAAAVKLGVAVSVEKVTDMAAIARAGVMSTPGISIDGKLVHAGGLPDEARLEGWLKG